MEMKEIKQLIELLNKFKNINYVKIRYNDEIEQVEQYAKGYKAKLKYGGV